MSATRHPTRLAHALCAAALLALVAVSPRPAFAQAIAAIVNGDPITTTEVEEQMKFRRLVKEPATRDAALEDLIGDRIKLRAANRAGIDASDAGFSQALAALSAKAKLTSAALLAELQRTKLNVDLLRSHVRALAAWDDLVKSRYKALSVSREEVDTAMAKSGGGRDVDYTLQQIVFVLPVNATPAIIEQRTREAEALRGRFQDCESGIPLARALPDVAIKSAITKSEASMNDATRKVLADVQKGRLSVPSRTSSGIELVAVCNKSTDTDTTTARETVQSSLLTQRLSKESDRMYKELRDRAIVVKR